MEKTIDSVMTEYIEVKPFDFGIDEDNQKQLSLFVEFMSDVKEDGICLDYLKRKFEEWLEDEEDVV